MIQTWKEVSLTPCGVLGKCSGLTNSREDMVVGGRSGQNSLYAYEIARNGRCTTCHPQHIMGAHSKEDGVMNFWGLGLTARMYSTCRYLYQSLNSRPTAGNTPFYLPYNGAIK